MSLVLLVFAFAVGLACGTGTADHASKTEPKNAILDFSSMTAIPSDWRNEETDKFELFVPASMVREKI